MVGERDSYEGKMFRENLKYVFVFWAAAASLGPGMLILGLMVGKAIEKLGV